MQVPNIRIVLVEPSHPGNIGAVARAMKTMGLTELVLVNPRKFPDQDANARAAGAEDVLIAARVESDLQSVLSDCTFILGTSVRERQVSWPISDPKHAASKIVDHLEQKQDHQVAILFGRENSGLANDELDLCQRQICIPANDDYSSLNLASAVQIIAYEVRMATLAKQSDDSSKVAVVRTKLEKRQQSASKEQLDGHFQHLEETLEMLDFIRSGPSTMLMRKLTRLYNKAELTIEEIQILRGILTAIQSNLAKSTNH